MDSQDIWASQVAPAFKEQLDRQELPDTPEQREAVALKDQQELPVRLVSAAIMARQA